VPVILEDAPQLGRTLSWIGITRTPSSAQEPLT
jgi:hypothetical protein